MHKPMNLRLGTPDAKKIRYKLELSDLFHPKSSIVVKDEDALSITPRPLVPKQKNSDE